MSQVLPRSLLAVLGLAVTAAAIPPSIAAPSSKTPRPSGVSPTAVLAEIAKAAKSGAQVRAAFPGRGHTVLEPKADRTLAPYFEVEGGDGQTELLPLKKTTSRVSIAGTIARIEVRQVFENTGRKPIEAIYVFPASTRAAVHGMRMRIKDRTIVAKIDRRATARATYESAKQEGRRASLLEQERPNVFTMNVANVMPGDTIDVELDYSELLVPEGGVYELVYPTVVGPRYGGGADPDRDRWIANPYQRAGKPPAMAFELSGHLEAGLPIRDLSSPSHGIDVTYAGQDAADFRLRKTDGGNRDFILRYRLADARIETGVLLWEGKNGRGQNEKFFAVLLEPPPRPTPAQIPPREYVFLLDVSGSMRGFPLDTAKALMRQLLQDLRPSDRFNVVLFAGASQVLFPAGSEPATPDRLSAAMAAIDGEQGGGGTELLEGLASSYGIPRPGRNVSRTVVVVTDGFVGVEAQAFRTVRERLGEANLFAFGIGSSVNRGLIEGLARAGLGEPFVVLRPDKAAEMATRLRQVIESPVLTGIKVKFDGFDAVEVAPSNLPDLLAERPLVLFGKYRGPASGRIEIDGFSGPGRFHRSLVVGADRVRPQNQALRWLWARKWVEVLEDERVMGGGEKAEAAITQLGLDYELLTAFTSFVAVDSEQANRSGQSTSVRQPLPMPEGVTDAAVAGGPLLYALQSPGRARAMPASPVAVNEMADLSSLGSGRGAGPAVASAERRRIARAPKKKTSAPPPEAAPGLSLQVLGQEGLTGSQPLLRALRNRLGTTQARCWEAARKLDLRLRLTIDRSGKVTGIEFLRGDRDLFGCLKAQLLGLTAATKATSEPRGTIEIRVQAG